MALGRTEAEFFGMPQLPLVEVPHHPSGGARPGEHRADAEISVDPVAAVLTQFAIPASVKTSSRR